VGAGSVVLQDVPPNCTVVGVPGRVVVREGARVDVVDLDHEDLPDPVVEMFRCIQHRIDRLDARVAHDAGTAEERVSGDVSGPAPGDAADADETPGSCDTGSEG
jgi:serine O-acetyltransferase